jgi:tagatose-6-phosphate ketose/aldose isomerase
MTMTAGRTSEALSRLHGPLDDWLSFLRQADEWDLLFGATPDEQERLGYRDTLREICQQPLTWLDTAARARDSLSILQAALARVAGNGSHGAIVLTGSGSSVYAGECLAPTLQSALQLPVTAVPSGELLTNPAGALPPRHPFLLVSLARSGNSPESCGVIDAMREGHPRGQHLVITCNRQGTLATRYAGDARVGTLVLGDPTCDKSLVMTSSFTNMVLAGLLLAASHDVPAYLRAADALASAGASLLLESGSALARLARTAYSSVVFLGGGCHLGAARESGLKMLEMTSGRVKTLCETPLGLRHGPMAAIDADTLLVCFLSSDAVARAYELDLLDELQRKKLGARKLLVGAGVPREGLAPDDLALDLPGVAGLGDAPLPILDVMIGQQLAFFRCLQEGLRPDQPSAEGVISRVVERFALHRRP